MGKLENRIALVTGAASGIGAATARRLAAEGARVAIADIDADRGRHIADELGNGGFFSLDVTSEEAWVSCIQAVESALGPLSILVNNAGISVPMPIEDATLEHWRLTMAINADGVFLGCKHGVRAMKANGGGSIINISSAVGIKGSPELPAYCASKGAVRLLTKSVAIWCARNNYGIRCNSVHPGAVDTPIIDPFVTKAPSREDGIKGFAANCPMGRIGRPEEIAATIAFLASEDASFITGAEVSVDGGMTA